MTETPANLLEFPCELAIKVMGVAAVDFEAVVLEIVGRHLGVPAPDAVRVRTSRGGRYVSLSITVEAHSRAQLDALYRELSAHERVLMAL